MVCFRTDWVFAKVYTDEGIDGVGESMLEYNDGYIINSTKPGIGIEINEEACLNQPYQMYTLRHYTGALTNICSEKANSIFKR